MSSGEVGFPAAFTVFFIGDAFVLIAIGIGIGSVVLPPVLVPVPGFCAARGRVRRVRRRRVFFIMCWDLVEEGTIALRKDEVKDSFLSMPLSL